MIMKTELWVIGKTNEKYLEEGISIYLSRLKHYLPFQMDIIPDVKNAGKLAPEQLVEKEGQIVLKRLKTDDLLILLDENGRSFTSEDFAAYIQQKLHSPAKRLVFLIGGAFGFSAEVRRRADDKLSLSRMTFSHQMARLFFLEQLYRAMTILRNEAYHNG